MKTKTNNFSNSLISIVCAAALYINLGGRLTSLWTLPALVIAITFLAAVPLLAFGFGFLWKNFVFFLKVLPKKRLIIIILLSLLPAILLTVVFPQRFSSSILITPDITNGQTVILLELKADDHVVPIAHIAADYGWEAMAHGISAGRSARPLLIKITSRIATQTTLIFGTSPQAGSAIVQYGRNRESINLNRSEAGEALISLRTTFRGFPNWLFAPIIIGADIMAFFLYAMILFLLQESGQQALSTKPNNEKFLSHRAGLSILSGFSTIVHLLNALAVPLIFGADSPSFIRGAFHLVQQGNFGGVSMIRGPGSTLLFAPVIGLFGDNPWGIKILLHLLALTLVPLSYRIGWQLSGQRRVAFLAGAATALIPDLYFFSNFLMSDLPNLVIVSGFTTLLISAFQSGKKRWILSSLLVSSFGTLLRSENLALLALGAITLAAQPIWEWFIRRKPGNLLITFIQRAVTVSIALCLALLPILWWSFQNYRNYGFFGMSNYAGEVFYTGWIYYAEASGYPLTNPSSPAVKAIHSAIEEFPIERMNAAGVPTGWNIYPSLIKAGYTSSDAFKLMSDATRDSIRSNPRLAREVLIVKLKDGLTPVPTQMKTFNLPGEEPIEENLKQQFFRNEKLRLSSIIRLQRAIYQPVQVFYQDFYPLLVWAGLIAAYFCLLRKLELTWWTLIIIALTRIFIPDIMGKSDWRYTLSGMVLIQAITVQWLAAIFRGIKNIFLEKKRSEG